MIRNYFFCHEEELLFKKFILFFDVTTKKPQNMLCAYLFFIYKYNTSAQVVASKT